MADELGVQVGQIVRLKLKGTAQVVEVRPDGKLVVEIKSTTGVRHTGEADDFGLGEQREVDAADVEPFEPSD